MSDFDFFDPDESAVNAEDIIAGLPIKEELKEWLCGMMSEKNVTPELEEEFVKFITHFKEKVGVEEPENDIVAFKCWVLFHTEMCYYPLSWEFFYRAKLPEFFDPGKFASESIKCIPHLFEPFNNKGRIFKPWVTGILEHICWYAKKTEDFNIQYQKALQECRETSTKMERVSHYLRQQKFPKPNFEEQPPSWANIGSTPFSLIWEMEGILRPEYNGFLMGNMMEGGAAFYFPRILLLPSFVHYGLAVYEQIRDCLDAIGVFRWYDRNFPISPIRKSGINDIKNFVVDRIPTIAKWDEQNPARWFFFELAISANNYSIIDKMFEGQDAGKIPSVFFEYLQNGKKIIHDILLKNCLHHIDLGGNWHNISVYLDWLLSQFDLASAEDVCIFFISYLKKTAIDHPPEKANLFLELFYPASHKTLKTVFEEIFRNVDTRMSLDIFIDAITDGMIAYSAEIVLPVERAKTEMWRYEVKSEYIFDVFASYTKKKKPSNTAEALLIAKFFFLSIFARDDRVEPSQGLRLGRTMDMFDNCVFVPNISNDDFVCRFLSIPDECGKKGTEKMLWLAIYLAFWVLEHFPASPSAYTQALNAIEDKKKEFTANIAEMIVSDWETTFKQIQHYKISLDFGDELVAFMFGAYIEAAKGRVDKRILFELRADHELHYRLHRLIYRQSHMEFVPEQFIDYLFSQEFEKTNRLSISSDETTYPLDLLRSACEAGHICKDDVTRSLAHFTISKFSDNIEKRISLLQELGKCLEYFLKPNGTECSADQEAFFTVFYERTKNETEFPFTEMYCFLYLWQHHQGAMESLFEKHQEWVGFLTNQCCKMINFLKNTVNKEFPVANASYYEKRHLFLPARFLGAKTSLWKGLKPLLLAFRALKIIHLSDRLYYYWPSLSQEIVNSFCGEDQNKLKKLREDMARDFIDRIKPATKPRNPENYTEAEREAEGFDLNYIEPSPIWRYAYIRALGNLRVKTDGRGHFFNEVLEEVKNSDPSQKVQKAAEKAQEELNKQRDGTEGGNHRRRLCNAFWWLRQAHMLSLGSEIDTNMASRIRQEEWRLDGLPEAWR